MAERQSVYRCTDCKVMVVASYQATFPRFVLPQGCPECGNEPGTLLLASMQEAASFFGYQWSEQDPA